jgi:putative SOS response-associated peptidase YedK
MTETEADQLRETVERMHGGTATLAQSVPAGKQPYAVALKGGGLMALAGLWETWRSPAGERVRSFAIITTEPNELCARLHNRMPAILAPEAWPAWLDEEPADLPHRSRGFRCRPGSAKCQARTQ